MLYKAEGTIGKGILSIETGHLAKQADGAVIVRYGDNVVMVTAVSSKEAREGIDFFPMSVDYREKMYAVGKYPGGFIKRETRPTTKEILTMRMIDRPLRPLFPKNYLNEVQIMASVLSADKEFDPDVLGMIGASAALSISTIPFQEAVGSVRIGRINNEFVVNPTFSELAESDLNLTVAGTAESILMVEASGKEVKEDEIIDALMAAQEVIKELVKLQNELREKCGKEKQTVPPIEKNDSLYQGIKSKFYTEIKEKNQTLGKEKRRETLGELLKTVIEDNSSDIESGAIAKGDVKEIFNDLGSEAARELILKESKRLDGRSFTGIRPITCEVGVLPRTHGSAVFTRGETQALVVVTLGTGEDEQRVEGLGEKYTKKFMLDYNFPPFCVGETKPNRGPGRREIGHGNLAERALSAVLPPTSEFPYTIRVVSEILESNGSSSMASVCGGSLSLMDAGVSISSPVAGIAMGLIKEGDNVCILSDITGDEDHFGDMDFKVTGTESGITALQMDIKIAGINREIMEKALNQAKEGRLAILQEIVNVIKQPRSELSDYAPRLCQIKINPNKIGLLIGPGGKMIKKIQEETGARLEIDDDGTVTISSVDGDSANKARVTVERLTEDVVVGKIYEGRVTSVKDFGAFVEILPGQEGLVHISELSNEYVEKVDKVVKCDQEISVKVLSIDDQKRIKLSAKAAMPS
ncbi:MAG: polyribonucleotide nucleotidyltransferase [Candidatus Anammoxibacter sp.]